MKKPLILGILTLFAAMTLTSCNKVTGIFTGKKITEVSIEAGEALITDDEDGVSNVEISCNNGLVIKAEWKRNSSNDYGYDIYEPEVNQDYNRLTVMIMARRVIANYLNGEYDD
jgi:predicted small secreted protein